MLYSVNNNQLFIEKWKYTQTLPRLKLADGRMVIGTEVDENNYLYYVIQRGNQITIERANKYRPIANYMKDTPTSVTVSNIPEVSVPIP